MEFPTLPHALCSSCLNHELVTTFLSSCAADYVLEFEVRISSSPNPIFTQTSATFNVTQRQFAAVVETPVITEIHREFEVSIQLLDRETGEEALNTDWKVRFDNSLRLLPELSHDKTVSLFLLCCIFNRCCILLCKSDIRLLAS